MALILHMHPLAAFCHKALIALYENNTPFEIGSVNLGDAESAKAHFARWPVGKLPVLEDTARRQMIPETSIIIEYLQQHYPGPAPMLPADEALRLDVRLWDRFFDLYISQQMTKFVIDRIRPEGQKDPAGVADAERMLGIAYGMLEQRMKDKTWAAGDTFTMADCAASPALFYADFILPFGPSRPHLAAYRTRLMERPAFARVLKDARPYFQYFPYHDRMPDKLLRG
jgi:glutathione S-transferase